MSTRTEDESPLEGAPKTQPTPESATDADPQSPPESAPDAKAESCQCCHPQAELECIGCRTGAGAMTAAIKQQIAKVGFAMAFIFDSDPPFAYSVGMTETHGLPEFAIVGRFPPTLISTVCAGIDHLARTAPDLLRGDAREVAGIAKCIGADGQATDTAFGYVPVAPENLTYEAALPMTRTLERYGPGGFEMRQVVIPDPGRKLPWHEGADPGWAQHCEQLALYAPQ